jgi:predicted metal-dependent phosphoesterase TrpH
VDPTPGRAFVDLHCHSSSSFDSLSKPADLVRNAKRFGLTHLAITDHERIDGAQRARDLGSDEVSVIVGEEVRTTGGDLLGLFLEQAVPPGMSPVETAAAIHEQGGLVGLPHPFDRFRSSGGAMAAADSLEELAAAIDFVEVHNARAVGRANERAALFAKEHGLPGVASSDAHSLMEVGVAYSVLPRDFSSAAELRALLAEADLVMGRGSYFLRAWTPIAKLVQRLRGNGRVRPPASATGPVRP